MLVSINLCVVFILHLVKAQKSECDIRPSKDSLSCRNVVLQPGILIVVQQVALTSFVVEEAGTYSWKVEWKEKVWKQSELPEGRYESPRADSIQQPHCGDILHYNLYNYLRNQSLVVFLPDVGQTH